jgi:hypothetical protein
MKRASRHRAGLRWWTKNGEPFWRGSVGDYRLGAITGLILRDNAPVLLPISESRLPIDRKCSWWTWHDLNVQPRPSQSRALIPLSYRSEYFQLPIANLFRVSRDQSAIGNRKSLNVMAETAGLEPAQDLARRFSKPLPYH